MALGVVLAAKLALLAGAPNAGFHSCYSQGLFEPTEGRCEVSFADPFRLSEGIRVDERFDFSQREANAFLAAQGGGIETQAGPLSQSNWNLSFSTTSATGGSGRGVPTATGSPSCSARAALWSWTGRRPCASPTWARG